MKKEKLSDEKLENIADCYFNKDEISYLEDERYNRLKNNVTKNKINKKHWWKYAISSASLIAIILCIVLPITLKPVQYYSYTELTRIDLTLDETQEYIEQNYPKYSFLFTDTDINFSYGLYGGKDIYILNVSGTKKDIPFTYFDISLVINQSVDYPEKSFYITDAEIISNDDYTYYKKIRLDFSDNVLYALLDYKDFDLYIYLGVDDEEFLNKFL